MARCPKCKEPVSQFAAGCAVCGTDLEAARKAAAQKRARRPSLPRLPAVPEDVVTIAFLSLVTIGFPLIGLILTFVAIQRNTLSTQGPLRNALWVIAGVGLFLLFSPATRYGLLDRL